MYISKEPNNKAIYNFKYCVGYYMAISNHVVFNFGIIFLTMVLCGLLSFSLKASSCLVHYLYIMANRCSVNLHHWTLD